MIIAITGLDGCGKTTQSKLTMKKLKSNNLNPVYIRPVYLLYSFFGKNSENVPNSISPRANKISENSNKSLKSKVSRYMLLVSAYPYALITAIHMKFLSQKKLLICDRYFEQFLFDIYGKKAKFFIKILPRPDLTFYLKNDLKTLYKQMESSADLCVGKEYYEQFLHFYNNISHMKNFIEINAKLNIEEVNCIIYSTILEQIGDNKHGLYQIK